MINEVTVSRTFILYVLSLVSDTQNAISQSYFQRGYSDPNRHTHTHTAVSLFKSNTQKWLLGRVCVFHVYNGNCNCTLRACKVTDVYM